MAMWRRQDELKPSTTAQEPVLSPASLSTSRADVSSVLSVDSPGVASAAPKGHLMISHTIRGEITGREDLYVNGEVQGKVHLEDAKIVIGPGGRVDADIEAREILVLGKVKGNLHGRDSVAIGRTGHVIGDILTRYISVEDSAQVQGSLDVIRDETPRFTAITEKAKAHYAG
jgi:cytoskeletal protein CcmA (bactofilin family)